ncbi:hypothetical protein MYCTH_93585 [Thermothelomyces thermophilus ATCC 42464]|uniref:Uncharacterized protein n=1 Tax=Thermothelomyces thermophilus (strain ATCC 42464 / BCRC 31852 / DSM 1799) TaxID=573729 RepID=G2QD16_THET4|nr:uncharacterized protein MYCTH_93585 [Thermothelomyces thermophilus ATCC 42464]AEO58234.1 hypothetical protein MYCTH_93585 [Thermothelomyces thermophilus ATCC 42464]
MEHRQSVGQSSDRAFVDHGDVSNELGNISNNSPEYNHSLLPSKLPIGDPLYSSLQQISLRTIYPDFAGASYIQDYDQKSCWEASCNGDGPFPGRTGTLAKHFQKAAHNRCRGARHRKFGRYRPRVARIYPFLHTGKPGTQDGVLRSPTPRVVKLPPKSATWPTDDISIERKDQKTRPSDNNLLGIPAINIITTTFRLNSSDLTISKLFP